MLREAKTWEDFEAMRQIRNESRAYMTRSSEYISPEGQIQWMNEVIRPGSPMKPYVLETLTAPAPDFGDEQTIIGYGIILYDHDSAYLTGAITSDDRGLGWGRALFQVLITEARKNAKIVLLEVLESNARARSLYDSLGFVEIARSKGVVKMVLREN